MTGRTGQDNGARGTIREAASVVDLTAGTARAPRRSEDPARLKRSDPQPSDPLGYEHTRGRAGNSAARPAAPAALAEKKHSGYGHRERLRARLLSGGSEALADYELLEFILFASISRRDTKGLAKRLIAHFGSFSAVMNAEPAALQQIPGIGQSSAAAIKSVALAARFMAKGEVQDKPVLSNWQALLEYLTIDMSHLTIERVRILYLDTRNRLVLDQHAGDGSIDEAAIHPREVVRRALDVGASGLILVHNHPSGNPEPSRADIQITRRIAEAGRLLNITLHDHVIIGRQGHVSLRAKGVI